MAALEVLDQRFRSRQANQDVRVKVAAHPGLGRSFVNVPRRWRIYRGHRNICLGHGVDDSRERLPNLASETET